MEWVEVTGRTVEEAREQALDLLGVAEEDTEIEVLAEPRMGLFGRLRDEARVRARLLPAVPRAKDDNARRRRRRPAGDTTVDQPVDVGAAAAAPGGAARSGGAAGAGEARGADRKGRAAAGRGGSLDEGTRRSDGQGGEATARSGGAGGRRSAGAKAARPDSAGRATVAVADDERDEKHVDTTTTDHEVPLAEQAEVARRFVDGLLETMGLEGCSTTIVEIDPSTVEVQVTGSELGMLIGPKGATLLALQDLARTVVQRATGARTGRLLLDVAGYRAKRKEALTRFTERVTQQVVATGEAVALEPMSSADRKIVHDTANALGGVSTSSEGEDPRRRVVVHPA